MGAFRLEDRFHVTSVLLVTRVNLYTPTHLNHVLKVSSYTEIKEEVEKDFKIDTLMKFWLIVAEIMVYLVLNLVNFAKLVRFLKYI